MSGGGGDFERLRIEQAGRQTGYAPPADPGTAAVLGRVTTPGGTIPAGRIVALDRYEITFPEIEGASATITRGQGSILAESRYEPVQTGQLVTAFFSDYRWAIVPAEQAGGMTIKLYLYLCCTAYFAGCKVSLYADARGDTLVSGPVTVPDAVGSIYSGQVELSVPGPGTYYVAVTNTGAYPFTRDLPPTPIVIDTRSTPYMVTMPQNWPSTDAPCYGYQFHLPGTLHLDDTHGVVTLTWRPPGPALYAGSWVGTADRQIPKSLTANPANCQPYTGDTSMVSVPLTFVVNLPCGPQTFGGNGSPTSHLLVTGPSFCGRPHFNPDFTYAGYSDSYVTGTATNGATWMATDGGRSNAEYAPLDIQYPSVNIQGILAAAYLYPTNTVLTLTT